MAVFPQHFNEGTHKDGITTGGQHQPTRTHPTAPTRKQIAKYSWISNPCPFSLSTRLPAAVHMSTERGTQAHDLARPRLWEHKHTRPLVMPTKKRVSSGYTPCPQELRYTPIVQQLMLSLITPAPTLPTPPTPSLPLITEYSWPF